MNILQFVVWCYENNINYTIITFPRSRSPDFYISLSDEFKPEEFLKSNYLKNKLAFKNITNISVNSNIFIIFYKE